jgi:hypothetical protein
MFRTGTIKIDKQLLAEVRRYADLSDYSSVEEFVAHPLREGRPVARTCRVGKGHAQAPQGARVHLVSALVTARLALGLRCRW